MAPGLGPAPLEDQSRPGGGDSARGFMNGMWVWRTDRVPQESSALGLPQTRKELLGKDFARFGLFINFNI